LIARRLSTLAFSLILLAGSLPPQAAAADKAEPLIVKDPQFGEVLFYFYQEDYFPAIVRLLAARERAQLGQQGDEAELLLGGMYLNYGQHLKAAEIFERLLAGSVDREIRDRTWFFLAKIWYQRGYLDEAQNALNRIETELPEPLEAERHMLVAQLLMASGRQREAIAILDAWSGRDTWASYAKYNLGVAMVRDGRVDEATEILDKLGRIDPWNEETRALRDKANLALGYALLQREDPAAAKRPLQRVRLDGPFSNKALLGVGWAEAEDEDYRRALVPWMELRGRDLLDPAVQESMLAIPYAMAKLDSIGQAADHYLDAIEAFYEESHRIDLAIERIESGAYLGDFLALDPRDTSGWQWKLEALPETTESRFLFHLLATHRFQEGLKNYRDLAFLLRNLETWQDSVVVFRNMLDTREIAYAERLPRTRDSLSQADLDGMVARKLDFDARRNSIEQSGDSLALATEREFELWGEITAIERNPALEADIPEAEDVRDKLKLLKGTLQWDLDREFKARLSRVRRDLRETGEALVETSRSRRQVDQNMQAEPLMFGELNDRVTGLSPRLDDLEARVREAMERQRAFMLGVAVDELRAQRQRLDTYTVQARFALAAIYDLAASGTATADAAGVVE